MRLKVLLAIYVVVLLDGCFNSDSVDTSRKQVESTIIQCKTEIESRTRRRLSSAVDNIYVHEFKAGYTVLFSHGAVGTFGQRSIEQTSVWSCGVVGERIVFLGSYPYPALIDESEQYPIEDYDQDVKEYLYTIKDDELEFCCMQDFNEKNIEKHNPGFFN